jgi:hypothetical protein
MCGLGLLWCSSGSSETKQRRLFLVLSIYKSQQKHLLMLLLLPLGSLLLLSGSSVEG